MKGNDVSQDTSNGNGIGLAGILTVLFIGLKLTGYVTWSWWLVLSPILVGMVLVVILMLLK